MTGLKFDIEKFDGKINFGLWQVQVKDILIQSGLHKALKEKSTVASSSGSDQSKASDDDWDNLDLKAASTIRLCLAKNVLANVHGISTAKGLWEKLEGLYQTKGVSNRVYLKEQFHTLRMSEGTTISDHLSVLNGIVSELEAIEVKIDDEDQALRLIWSLPSSYEHMKPILLHGKEKVVLSEVIGKLLSEERRLKGGKDVSSENMLACYGKERKQPMKKNVVCWKCGQSGHLKKNCKRGGAGSASSSKSDTEAINVSIGDDDFL